MSNRSTMGITVLSAWCVLAGSPVVAGEKAGPIEPRVIPLDFSVSDGSSGGVLAADLDGDGRMDFVVTSQGHIGGHRLDGARLWHLRENVRVSAGSSESVGLPGHHAPGVQVADVDGDGQAELLYLDQSSTVHIRDAKTGKEERSVRVPHPPSNPWRWSASGGPVGERGWRRVAGRGVALGAARAAAVSSGGEGEAVHVPVREGSGSEPRLKADFPRASRTSRTMEPSRRTTPNRSSDDRGVPCAVSSFFRSG